MKKISLVLFLLLGTISCKPKITNSQVNFDVILQHKYDSINTELNVAKDSIIYLNKLIKTKDEFYENHLKSLRQCDSSNANLRAELFVANYKLGRIKEYCDIVKKNNSQLQFLRGWIIRVLDE